MNAEDLQRDLERCAEHLVPLFGLEGKLEIEVESELSAIEIDRGTEAKLKEIGAEGVVPGAVIGEDTSFRISYNDETLYDDIGEKFTEPEDVGTFLGELLYAKANPVMCDLGQGPPSDKTQLARYEAHRIVEDTVAYLCGESYADFKEQSCGTPFQMEEDEEEDENLGSEFNANEECIRKAQRAKYVEIITAELYTKHGQKAIADLARLSFRDARKYILAETRVDILNPEGNGEE